MRLDGQEESENVEDRRGMGAKGGAALGGGGLILVLLISLIFHKDPAKVAQQLSAGSGQNTQQPGGAAPDPREDQVAHFTKVILGDTEVVWTDQFRAMGREYPKPTLVLFSGAVDSACGMAESATGPFYCPGDQKVYIDLSFYADMQRELHAPGDFARAYVVAHEVGHHVQRLLGYSKQVDALQSRGGDKVAANHASVRLELQADYFAGVWAHYGDQKFHFLEKGDIESALNAAHQIGDDRLQQQARGRVVPDSFTHGTSAQRARWFKRGFDTGDIKAASLLFSLPYEQL
jgi:hypothetical protein